ncbi:hypothetical protein GOP47_0003027 [Adiantum capillus-veneris]|uniref:Uncharacterized protein n=1 Tax=Adiantum capillus-veneris TaxID=13818 RepID=A0A9D4VBZ7_ADICA|nr:hypothetical protein GOP47_0003027 [Adiantum capillus-veneris]
MDRRAVLEALASAKRDGPVREEQEKLAKLKKPSPQTASRLPAQRRFEYDGTFFGPRQTSVSESVLETVRRQRRLGASSNKLNQDESLVALGNKDAQESLPEAGNEVDLQKTVGKKRPKSTAMYDYSFLNDDDQDPIEALERQDLGSQAREEEVVQEPRGTSPSVVVEKSSMRPTKHMKVSQSKSKKLKPATKQEKREKRERERESPTKSSSFDSIPMHFPTSKEIPNLEKKGKEPSTKAYSSHSTPRHLPTSKASPKEMREDSHIKARSSHQPKRKRSSCIDEEANIQFNITNEIHRIMGYDPRRHASIEEDDDDTNMVSSFRQVQAEERKSARIAKEEDARELALIEQEEKEERARKRKKKKK